MRIQTQVREDLTVATKSGDRATMGATRLLLSALEYKRMQKSDAASIEGISDEEELAVVRTEVKKRQEAIDIYTKVGEKDREAIERNELEYMAKFLPTQVGEDEVKAVVERLKTTETNKGILIGKVIAEIGKDKVDGGMVAKIVSQLA